VFKIVAILAQPFNTFCRTGEGLPTFQIAEETMTFILDLVENVGIYREGLIWLNK
jgi:hypothetical protein